MVPVSVPMKWYGISMVLSTVLYCIIIFMNFVVNSHVSDPGLCLKNDTFTVVTIIIDTNTS